MLAISEIDKLLLNQDFLHKNIVSDKKKGLEPIKTLKDQVILVDELYLIGDRRSSMKPEQIEYISTTNRYAYLNNIIIGSIQDATDLDSRIQTQANVVFLEYERGISLVYIRLKNFPIAKLIHDFEIFQKDTYLLKDKTTALNNLRGINGYVGTIHTSDLDLTNLLYSKYKEIYKPSPLLPVVAEEIDQNNIYYIQAKKILEFAHKEHLTKEEIDLLIKNAQF